MTASGTIGSRRPRARNTLPVEDEPTRFERYRTLLENANDTITVLGIDGVILEANEHWRDALGISPEEMIGKHIREYAAPGHEAANAELFARLVAQGRGREDAVPIVRPDGRVLYMEFSVALVEVGAETLVFAIGRDVTQRVDAKDAVADAELRHRSIMERIQDVVWTCNGDGTLTFLTQNVERVLGYTAAELCAEDFETLLSRVHPDDRARLRSACCGVGQRGEPFDLEYRHQRKGGGWLWIRNRTAAVYEVDGVRYVEGIATDVTERKQLEESMRLAQKMEAIGQLTGAIAHDFNNILAAIVANSHFLIDELADSDPRRADAHEIKESAERAAALTRQLLAFSRRQVLEPTIVDLNATIATLERMLGRLIGEDVEFSVTPSADPGSVCVDISQIEQVIMNLVVNARDAMPTGGKLVIETANVVLDGHARANRIPLPPGKYVMLRVSDTGCGMDTETQRRIFEPFFTTKEIGKGTGLGLSTSHGIVKQTGGCILVQSEIGRGTVFRIYLPQVEQTPVPTKPRITAFDARGTETILLVEDDEPVRSAVQRMLEPRGYRLLIARSGIEAVDLARTYAGRIDLVLSDVVMPGACGPKVVDLVRECTGAVRSLFMSGHTDHAVLRNDALQRAMNFIQKPFAPEALARKVREVLEAESTPPFAPCTCSGEQRPRLSPHRS